MIYNSHSTLFDFTRFFVSFFKVNALAVLSNFMTLFVQNVTFQVAFFNLVKNSTRYAQNHTPKKARSERYFGLKLSKSNSMQRGKNLSAQSASDPTQFICLILIIFGPDRDSYFSKEILVTSFKFKTGVPKLLVPAGFMHNTFDYSVFYLFPCF